MNNDACALLATTKKELDRVANIRAELPRLREELGEGLFQLDRLEARVDELDAQVASLASFSIASLASSL